ncbi:hypothetical protein SynA1524_01711 [Synechococcus sp. A15-24]|nr:hypothetical protein SynA1524_01711 [Synechococcus sp. A15-24]
MKKAITLVTDYPEATAKAFPARHQGSHTEAGRLGAGGNKKPAIADGVSVLSGDGLETEALYSTAAAASTPGHMAAN